MKAMINKKLKQLKRWWWVHVVYRTVRNNLVHRMHANGMSWVNINKVLNSMGQKHVVKVEHTPQGPAVTFAEPETVTVSRYNERKKRFEVVKEYKQPDVIDKR